MMRAIRAAAFAAALFMIPACASSGHRLDGLDADALFQAGEQAMLEEDWQDAIEAFERFTLQYPTHARSQEARYRLGVARFEDREYITAANEFSRLATDFPAGPWADDARFRVCESYYELSPHPQLDQEYTRGALDHCQSLMSYYPDSEFVPRASEMLQDLRNKLAAKLFQAGEFYKKRGAIDSAIIYYESTVAEYPTTALAPRALLRLYEAYSELGYDSDAESARERLLRDFPDSAEAERLASGSAADGG